MLCPADCVDDTLVANKSGDCDLKIRKRNIDRIGFYPCNVDLPTPFDCDALLTLKNANQLAFTSPLANIEVGDPTFEELQIADCRPADRIVTGRTITFQDRIAIDIPATTSPVADATPFFDYDFWQDKKEKKAMLRYLLVYCDGSVVIPKDDTGNAMVANLDVFLSYERQGSGGTSYIMEIKKGQLDFKGDPLAFNKPEVDADNVVFDISACAGLL